MKGVQINMFEELLNALRSTGIEFAENAWVDAHKIGGNADYGCVSIDNAGRTVWSDDTLREQAVEGTVDLFCHGSGREHAVTIQNIFSMLHVSFRLSDVSYEQDTRLTHWTWVFQLETW